MRADMKLSKQLAEYWKSYVNLRDWHFNIERTRSTKGMAFIDVVGYDQEDLGPIEARVGTIKINFSLIDNKKELSKAILHELIHVVLSKVVSACVDTTDLERAVRSMEEAIWHFHLESQNKGDT